MYHTTIWHRKSLPGINPAGSLHLDFHPAGQLKHNSVLAVYRHGVNQRRPLSLVEFGVEFRKSADRLDEAFQLSPADRPLPYLLGDIIPLRFRLLVPAHQRVVTFPVLGLVLRHPRVLRYQVVHRFGVNSELLVQFSFFLLKLRRFGKPVLDG